MGESNRVVTVFIRTMSALIAFCIIRHTYGKYFIVQVQFPVNVYKIQPFDRLIKKKTTKQTRTYNTATVELNCPPVATEVAHI